MTYRIALIWDANGALTTVDVEGVPMSAMKATILRMKDAHKVPSSATLHVEQESPRKVYFRNLLSSVPSLNVA